MMKLKYMILAGGLLAMGLTSCEMKNEIFGNKNQPSEMGLLNLSVEVDAKSNDVVTKAGGTQDEGTDPGKPVDPKGYKVEISNSEELYKTLDYDPESRAVELPVGDYSLYAHTPGKPQETEAYYGVRNTLKIEKGLTSEMKLICRMMNTKIQLVYDSSMQTYFKGWEVVVTAGSSKSKTFKYEGTNFENPAAFFWMMEEGTKEIRVSFKGTTEEGKTATESRLIRKPAASSDANWVGGDVLTITMHAKPGAPDEPSGVLGIDINAEVKWDRMENTVDAPVVNEEEPTEPEQPETSDLIQVTIPQTTYTLPADKEEEAVARIKAVKGLKSLKVVIEAGNEGFGGVISSEDIINQGVDFSKGVELVDQAKDSPVMELIAAIAPDLKAPVSGETSYEFPLGAFFNALSLFGSTDQNAHVFKIYIEDQDGNRNNDTALSIKIEEQAQ